MLGARMRVGVGRVASGGGPVAVPSSFSLDLSGVSTRQLMTTWDNRWQDEYSAHFLNFQWQVDPGNGGQIGVWTNDGNPASDPGVNLDYSNFIEAGPEAGLPVRVRMRFVYQTDWMWVSSAHTDGGSNRRHYEVAARSNELAVFKFFGPDPTVNYVQTATAGATLVPGNTYWITLDETRAGNAVDGTPTIDGEVLEDDAGSPGASIATIQYVDDGSTFGAILNATRRSGFGSFSAADGLGPKVLAWDVGPPP